LQEAASQLARAQAVQEGLQATVCDLESKLAAAVEDGLLARQQAASQDAAHSMRFADLEQQWASASEDIQRLTLELASSRGEC
jgi:hypothetical protein